VASSDGMARAVDGEHSNLGVGEHVPCAPPPGATDPGTRSLRRKTGKCHGGLRANAVSLVADERRCFTALPWVDAGQCCLGSNASCYRRNSCCPPSRHREPGVSDSSPPSTNCSSRSLVPLPTVPCSTPFVIPVPTAPTHTRRMLD